MPRKARLLVPNCPHHIVQRGHNRKTIFVADDDYQYYLDNLREYKINFGVKVYAWCLMTNHVHLIIEPGEEVDAVSRLMTRLAGRQTAYVNKLEGRSGSLWEGRFKASPIQRDAYLLACCRYIELNPVRAGMVSDPKQYRWSSYGMRIGDTPTHWLDQDLCYLGLGDHEDQRRKRYAQFVIDGMSTSDHRLMREAIQRNQLTGSNRFIEEIESRTGKRIVRRGRGRPKSESVEK